MYKHCIIIQPFSGFFCVSRKNLYATCNDKSSEKMKTGTFQIITEPKSVSRLVTNTTVRNAKQFSPKASLINSNCMHGYEERNRVF